MIEEQSSIYLKEKTEIQYAWMITLMLNNISSDIQRFFALKTNGTWVLTGRIENMLWTSSSAQQINALLHLEDKFIDEPS